MNSRLPTGKQQRQILIVTILGAFLVSWATISYFSTHPNLITYINPSELNTVITNNEKKTIGNTNKDMLTLMQKIQINSNDINAFIELSKYFIQLSESEQAKIFALQALEITPDNPDLIYLLGIIQHNQGEHVNAANSFKKILEKDADPSAQYSLALLYLYYLNEKSTALQYLYAVLNNPKSTPAMITAVNNICKEMKEEVDPIGN